MKNIILITLLFGGIWASEIREYNIGAQWNIEYRVQRNDGVMQVSFANRRDSDILVRFNIIPGFGSSDPEKSGSIVIGSKADAVYTIGKSEGTKQEVKITDYLEGMIVSKSISIVDGNGNITERNENVFLENTTDDLDVLAGSNVYEVVKKLNMGYNKQWISNNIISVGYWRNGPSDNDLIYVTSRMIKVPSKITKDGKPIWNLIIELNGDSISKIQRIYEYFKK